jgi:hypothetical protein
MIMLAKQKRLGMGKNPSVRATSLFTSSSIGQNRQAKAANRSLQGM